MVPAGADSRLAPGRYGTRASPTRNNLQSRMAVARASPASSPTQSPKKFGGSPQQQQGNNYNMARSSQWKALSQLEVKLTRLPPQFNTWDIYRLLETYGNITRIDIFDGERNKAKTAFVIFR